MLLKPRLIAAAMGCAMALSAFASPLAADEAAPSGEKPGRSLLLADEFNGEALDRAIWNVVGPDEWYNNEEQVYVDDPAVLSIINGISGADGGVLMLRPVFKPGLDPHPERRADFLSARIHTKGKFDFKYGRAEARIRLPEGEGVWPAWWLLGNGKWPTTGEIDIMEYVGETDWVAAAIHGSGYSGDTPFQNRFFFPQGESVRDWHVYAVEWTSDVITFEVDGHVYYRVTRDMVEHYNDWRFDNPQHLILNFAVGGIYPDKTFGVEKPYPGVPQETVEKIKTGNLAMLVDWVRVWAPEEPAVAE